LRCGQVGHEEAKCGVPLNQVLNTAQRREVERQESEHERLVEKRIARLREKQMGEHGSKIPEVKTSGDGASKRKREMGVDEARKEVKTGKAGVGVNMPGAPTEPAASRPRPAGIGGALVTARPSGQAPLIKKKRATESSLFARKRKTDCIARAFMIGSDQYLTGLMHMSVSEQVTCGKGIGRSTTEFTAPVDYPT
jgi:hypothetical protein